MEVRYVNCMVCWEWWEKESRIKILTHDGSHDSPPQGLKGLQSLTNIKRFEGGLTYSPSPAVLSWSSSTLWYSLIHLAVYLAPVKERTENDHSISWVHVWLFRLRPQTAIFCANLSILTYFELTFTLHMNEGISWYRIETRALHSRPLCTMNKHFILSVFTILSLLHLSMSIPIPSDIDSIFQVGHQDSPLALVSSRNVFPAFWRICKFKTFWIFSVDMKSPKGQLCYSISWWTRFRKKTVLMVSTLKMEKEPSQSRWDFQKISSLIRQNFRELVEETEKCFGDVTSMPFLASNLNPSSDYWQPQCSCSQNIFENSWINRFDFLKVSPTFLLSWNMILHKSKDPHIRFEITFIQWQSKEYNNRQIFFRE